MLLVTVLTAAVLTGDDGAVATLKWRYHLAREHERLYPTPDQHNYELTA